MTCFWPVKKIKFTCEIIRCENLKEIKRPLKMRLTRFDGVIVNEHQIKAMF